MHFTTAAEAEMQEIPAICRNPIYQAGTTSYGLHVSNLQLGNLNYTAEA
jgi:hypothetical protein